LAEFTLKGAGGQDFYDVSLVDGTIYPLEFNPLMAHPTDRWRNTTAILPVVMQTSMLNVPGISDQK